MRRRVSLPLIVLLALAITPAAFAQLCYVCTSPTWCASGQPEGWSDCYYEQDPPWCVEDGVTCPALSASLSATWKVAVVTVVRPGTPLRATSSILAATTESAAVRRSPAVSSARIRPDEQR